MKYTLSFGDIIILSDHLAEVIVDEGIVMTLEMCEEYDAFLLDHFPQPFALLINKIHNYSYTYEAKLHIASLENLKAFAFLTYNQNGLTETKNLVKQRKADDWNMREFCGLDMGRDKAMKWLKKEMATINVG